jgi:type II secretion system protein H
MLTLGLGTCKRMKHAVHPVQHGFTLLELLVVVVVLSIATALIVVKGTPSDKSHLQAEAQKLAQLLRIAQQQAKLTSKDIRFVSSPEGYRFEELSNARWVLVQKEPLLQPRAWEHGPFSVHIMQGGVDTSSLLLESQQGLIPQSITLQRNQTEVTIERTNGGPFRVN